VNRINVNKRISDSQVPWRDGTEGVRDHSIVFVQQSGAYLLFLNPFSSNNADLDGRILWSTDQGPGDLDLIARHPDRAAYLQRTSVPPNKAVPDSDPLTPVVTTQRLHVVEAGVVTLHTTVTNTTNHPVVVVSLRVGDQVEQQTLATDSRQGDTYDVEWRFTAPDGNDPLFAGGAGLVRPAAGLGNATITAGYGSSEAAAAGTPSVRQVVPYRAGGTMQLLMPARPAYYGTPNGKPGWLEVGSMRELQVKATG
jgi:hypothetical protein